VREAASASARDVSDSGDSGAWSGEKALFFRHWRRRPLGIGAVLPSSAAVAAAMAGALNLSRPGIVLELGGGTGSLTHGLLASGCPPERLISIEREPGLAALLRRRFPAIRVIEGDAAALGDILDAHETGRLAGVVSSLPIKWFPFAVQRDVVDAGDRGGQRRHQRYRDVLARHSAVGGRPPRAHRPGGRGHRRRVVVRPDGRVSVSISIFVAAARDRRHSALCVA
jgi:phospholipid N-methyltransferase